MSFILHPVAAMRRNCVRLCGAATLFAATIAAAQDASLGAYQAATQGWLEEAVASAQVASATPLRLEVSVGGIDPRLKLAACANMEPYVPPGSRLWGKTRIGLRCMDGVTRWNITMPVTVKAFGSAWVVSGHVPAGATVGEADVVRVEVDWAEQASPVITDRAGWLGQVATRLLTTGQTLREGMVRPAQVFQAGTQVRVVATGAGFQISSDAQALSAGVVGQVARVRMENGRVTSGQVLDTRTVKIDL